MNDKACKSCIYCSYNSDVPSFSRCMASEQATDLVSGEKNWEFCSMIRLMQEECPNYKENFFGNKVG